MAANEFDEMTKPMRMPGRYSSVIRYHAVPSGHRWTTAICGIKPKQRGNGWSEDVGDAVTCPKCLARLARDRLDEGRAAP